VFFEGEAYRRFQNEDRRNILKTYRKYHTILKFITTGEYPRYCSDKWMSNLRDNYGSYYLTYIILFQLRRELGFDYYNSLVITLTISYSDSFNFGNILLDRDVFDNRIMVILSSNGLVKMDPSRLYKDSIIISKIIKMGFGYDLQDLIQELFIRMGSSITTLMRKINLPVGFLSGMISSILRYRSNPQYASEVTGEISEYSLEYEHGVNLNVIPDKSTDFFRVYIK
jgi:hypothetical protein